MKMGLLRNKYPNRYKEQEFIKLTDWQNLKTGFFFENKAHISFPKNPNKKLECEFQALLDGKYTYFHSKEYDLGFNFDWLVNPDNSFKYDIKKHWTEIYDYTEREGDIKYVWELSRFTFLYTIIRYDYHFEKDHSKFVLEKILHWIASNPINMGPNYRCSQEICIRLLNWIFALYYYKESPFLSQEIFNKIINSIYWQLIHVKQNINFSRITVRNNHALTETLTLYLIGTLFPFLPKAAEYSKYGKKWFEEEVEYQIYSDGTFLQFSMNYHRVVIQLLTWAFYISDNIGERFGDHIYEKAKRSVEYLFNCQNKNTGHLPNYGANDGSLFFPLNNCDFGDYRPQLNALYYYLEKKNLYADEKIYEDVRWFCRDHQTLQSEIILAAIRKYEDGGYYIMRDYDSLTFVKCGSYKDRPSHADNLHIDIWYNTKNIMRDSGSYKYNSKKEDIIYFNGTEAHNTIMLGEYDQMEKGPRFIWLKWSEAIYAKLSENNDYYEFSGAIKAFKHVAPNIIHHRTIRKYKESMIWEITDEVSHSTKKPLVQIWHPSEEFFEIFQITALDEYNNEIKMETNTGWISTNYGIKEKAIQLKYISRTKRISTKIFRKL